METAGHETPSGVRELRLAVTAAHWEAAVAFYRDELGLRQLDDFSSDRGRVVLLDAGRATLELVDEDQAAFIDEVEVGRPGRRPHPSRPQGRRRPRHVRPPHRRRRRSHRPTTRTPWNSLNARLQAPAALQLTLFEEPLEPPEPAGRIRRL